MKKNQAIALLLCMLVFSGITILSADDFFGADWGMKKRQVETSVKEELTFYEGSGFSVLGTDIIPVYNRECIVVYFFSHKGNLVKGGYFFRPRYQDGTMFKSDYDRLTDIFMDKFGESKEQFMWNTEWHYEPREYMKAVKNGDLTMMNFWETETSYIELSLSGDSSGYKLSVQYYSKDLYGEYVDMLLEKAIAEGAIEPPEWDEDGESDDFLGSGR